MIVWTDSGRPICENDTLKWMLKTAEEKYSITYFPVVSQRLQDDFDSRLQNGLAANDSFYALSKIPKMITLAEKRFLNLLLQKLIHLDRVQRHKRINPEEDDDDLLDMRSILHRHIDLLRDEIYMLPSVNAWQWPRTPDSLADKDLIEIEKLRKTMQQDFEHLHSEACRVLTRCNMSLQIGSQSMQLRESHRSTREARSITNLTRLAFVFIPLSYFSTFFGMNFKELGQGSLSIWVYFLVAAPVLAASVAFLVYCDWMLPAIKREWRKTAMSLSNWNQNRRLRRHFWADEVARHRFEDVVAAPYDIYAYIRHPWRRPMIKNRIRELLGKGSQDESIGGQP